MRARLITVWVAASILLSLAGAGKAWAITAWARRYNADCSMCHVRLNRLNGFGKAFLKQGHRLPGEDAREDSKLRPLDNYLALTGKIRFEAEGHTPRKADPSTKFGIEALSIYMGGPLTRRIDFFTEQYLHDPVKNDTTLIGGGRAKLADLYAVYRFSDNPSSGLHLRMGQFTPYLLHSHYEGARLSVSRPVPIQEPFVSYNPARVRDRMTGLELNYLRGPWLASAGIANTAGGTTTPNILEKDNFKDRFGTVEYVYDARGSSVGIWAYDGRFPVAQGVWWPAVAGETPLPASPAYADEFTRVGVFADYLRDRISLVGAAVMGEDKRPIQNPSDGTVSRWSKPQSRSWFVTGEYLFAPEWAAFARYDYLDHDTRAVGDVITGPTVGISRSLGTSGRVAAELTLVQNGTAANPKATDRKAVVEWQWMY